MDKMIKALQFIWLAIALVALFLGAYYVAKGNFKDGIFFFIITFAGGLMYAINKRRYQRYFNQQQKQ